MKYALFLGCTIPARARNYELSARKVAHRLGIALKDMEAFICCGFPTKSSDHRAAELLGAFNLALAQSENLDLMTLCSSCTSALTEVAHRLSEQDEAKKVINERLSGTGVQYDGQVRVRHFARVLCEDVGKDEIKKHLEKDLSDLKIAIHYGCHYLKPSGIYEGFDSAEDPKTLDELIGLTGAQVVDYMDRSRCCGGPLLPVDEKTALSMAKAKLDDVKAAGADALCLVCPFCSVMYDSNQKGIETTFETTYGLPVLYLPQVLGIAMGFDRKELGLNLNVVKTKELLKPYFDQASS
jgi:heterodisulfide reductase subunit B